MASLGAVLFALIVHVWRHGSTTYVLWICICSDWSHGLPLLLPGGLVHCHQQRVKDGQ